MKRARKVEVPLTTSQRLGSLIKAARDIMRKDKGLSGDLDRLPMLTWIFFLKFLDDMERLEEDKAALKGSKYRSAIAAPYRWRDWAAKEDGITGDELIAFVNQETAVRPDGKSGPGLFAYLRKLQGASGGDRCDVIAAVFRGTVNRMVNGYLLRDVVNKVSGIHFDSSEEILTLGHLYESMLREMRDAAGDSGEFYTPRPVVRFIVEVMNPRLGETILDPACGTGGFLVEAYRHLEAQCKKVEDRRTLQERSLLGGEAKPLPYLLGQMNLLLHGLDYPRIDPGNSLSVKVTEIGDRDRVDVIMTNPPFGGEEERGIQGNFPDDKRTGETALLFLQLIMRRLKRPGHGSETGGRAAVVVPNPTLVDDGVAARIKEDLIRNFNLHTVLRLPNGVFSPYTNIPTNVFFFDRSGPTRDIWYYEIRRGKGQRNYSKTNPMQIEEFARCLSWWANRAINDNAWKVAARDVLKYDESGQLVSVMLDLQHPDAPSDVDREPPEKLLRSVLERQHRFVDLVEQMSNTIPAEQPSSQLRRVQLRQVLDEVPDPVIVDPSASYPNIGIYSFGRGLFEKQPISGQKTSARVLYRVRTGQFIYSRLFAFEGAFGVVGGSFDGWFVSNEYPHFRCDPSLLHPEFLALLLKRPSVWRELALVSKGLGDRRQRLQPERLLEHEVLLPSLAVQRQLTRLEADVEAAKALQAESSAELDALLPSIFDKAIRGEA